MKKYYKYILIFLFVLSITGVVIFGYNINVKESADLIDDEIEESTNSNDENSDVIFPDEESLDDNKLDNEEVDNGDLSSDSNDEIDNDKIPDDEDKEDNNSNANDSNTDSNNNGDSSNSNDDVNNDNNSADDNTQEEIDYDEYIAENISLTKSLSDNYGVTVFYDNVPDPYYYGSVDAVMTTREDAVLVNMALKGINTYIKNIPNSILTDMRLSCGYRIELYTYLPFGARGLADYSSYGNYRVMLDINVDKIERYERIIYHETFHLMERYMYNLNGWENAFGFWNNYNPSDFVYGSTGAEYTYYDKNADLIDRDFVGPSTKSSAVEDRAEIFEAIMAGSSDDVFFSKGYGINEKGIYLINVVESYFGSFPQAKWHSVLDRS